MEHLSLEPVPAQGAGIARGDSTFYTTMLAPVDSFGSKLCSSDLIFYKSVYLGWSLKMLWLVFWHSCSW